MDHKECINSFGSDDQTGMDSFHECLQEYGEGLEVVQICMEPEDGSLKDEELSALDFSIDENYIIKTKMFNGEMDKEKVENIKLNGVNEIKCTQSEELVDEHDDDDMTITEDDILLSPRELPDARRKSIEGKSLSKQQSKDISTSDEMVFAVTPTGLERISFDRYWKEADASKIDGQLPKVKSDESWKECNSPNDDTSSFYDAKISVHESSTLMFIDHDIDGYETCLDDDINSTKINVKTDDRKINDSTDNIKEDKQIIKEDKQIKIDASVIIDNDKTKTVKKSQIVSDVDDEESYYGQPYIQEHIIKQMQSLRIEPLNVNIGRKKKRSPTKPSKRKCIEYYNDQAECLEEYKRQKKLEEEERQTKQEQEKMLKSNLQVIEKKMQLKKHKPSEDSTDAEGAYDPSCHKCFLENYAYELTKAYIAETSTCKYCDVIRDMLELESPKDFPERRLSAPALIGLDSGTSETEDEDQLLLPKDTERDRRKSAGPLKFLVPSRRMSCMPPTMTVTASPGRRELPAQRWGPPRRVVLERSPGAPLGVSIVGGKVDIISSHDESEGEEKSIFGIFIKNVVPSSPAGNCNELNTGDRILEVDGVCVRSASHERAVQLIKAAGNQVTLTVQSLVAWNTDSSDVDGSSPVASRAPSIKKAPAPSPPHVEEPQHEIKITVSEPDNEHPEVEKEPSETKPVYSDSDSDDEEDERDLGGRTYTDKGVEIDRASAGAVKRSREEKEADREEEDDFGYTTNKIRKKYSPLGDTVVSVRLERSPKGGLGISLAGHRDRSRMAVFVCGLHPAGAASRADPPLKIGDEILEVNGIVLHGRCHLNASAIIKGLAGPTFKIIVLRRKQALEDVAVKPLTQFPVALEESEDRFASYKGVRNVSIKKGSSSLGIMIIEGRHAEVGQGIFISDIQEGSAAEQAGLHIGDMILAVNKDSLLGCSYDAAAATLKRTEGVVVLTVCNPNKKDDSPAEDAAGGSVGGPSGPTSGNHTPDPGGLKVGGASRPTTPKPSPAKVEPPPDPATAEIVSNKETVIEINTDGKSLSVTIVGGSDTAVTGPAAVILDIYEGGPAAKDARLRLGDQVLECNGIKLTPDMSNERIRMHLIQPYPKFKLTIYRPDPVPYTELEVELTKKPGKCFGLSTRELCPPPGHYVNQILPGSAADLDGRIQKYDRIVAIDGKDVLTADNTTVAIAMKVAGPKMVIKVKRFKIVR